MKLMKPVRRLCLCFFLSSFVFPDKFTKTKIGDDVIEVEVEVQHLEWNKDQVPDGLLEGLIQYS